MKKKDELTDLKDFKSLLNEMYETYPNTFSSEELVQPIIRSEEVSNKLVEHGILYSYISNDQGKKRYFYGLGPNGLQLISAWKTEELTRRMTALTFLITVLSILTAMIALIKL